MTEAVKPIPEMAMKVVVVGDKAVGKTAMILSLCTKRFIQNDYIPTVRTVFEDWTTTYYYKG